MSTFHGCSRLGAAMLTVVGIGAYYAGAWIISGLMAVLVIVVISPTLWAWWRQKHEPDDTDYEGFK